MAPTSRSRCGRLEPAARSNVCRELRRRARAAVYAPTSSSSRNHSGVRSAPASGMPDTTTRPPALAVRSAMSSALFDPTHSIATSAPPSRNSWPRSGFSFDRARVPPHALGGVLRRDDLVGAGQRAAAALLLVLRRDDHVPGLGEELAAPSASGCRRCPRRPPARSRPARRARPERRVDRARERLDQHGDASFETASGIACSCERWATIIPPSRRRCRRSSRSAGRASGAPTVTRSHRSVAPAAQFGHGGSPRAAHDSTLPITTRVPDRQVVDSRP